MKTYLIPIIISVVVLVMYFSILPTTIQEDPLSKQCDIPYDVNFIDRRSMVAGSGYGKFNYSIDAEFSIFYTVPIGEFRVDDVSHSLILKPVVSSYGYIIMCDPLPVLEKRFETKLHGLFVLIDGEEIEPDLVNDVLRIDVNNNTRIEIIGFSLDSSRGQSQDGPKQSPIHKILDYCSANEVNMQPLYKFSNSTHYIDSTTCEWQIDYRLFDILDRCDEIKRTGTFDGFAYGSSWQNETHYIDNIDCKWQKRK